MAITKYTHIDGTETAIAGDIPVATVSTAGKVKPDGTTITIAEDGTISSAGGSGDAYPLTTAQMDALLALL